MITGDTSLKIMADEWALLRLSWLYARAMDRNEPDTLAAIFTADAKLEGDWFKVEGIEQIKQLPTGLSKRYAGMMHTVHNQTVDIADDRAAGETYCLAHHLIEEVRFHGQHDDILLAGLGRLVDRLHLGGLHLAVMPLQLQAVLLDRGEMGALVDHGDILAGERELPETNPAQLKLS